MKWKKIVSVLFTAIIIVTTITGCNNIKSRTVEKEEKEEKDIAMGRYIEEAIDMPEEVKAGKEIAYQMIKNPDGGLEIYCIALEPANGEATIQYTLREDNSWERKIPEWLNQDGMGSVMVTYAPDGTRYAIESEYGEGNIIAHILRSTDGIKSEELVIDDFKDPFDYGNSPNGIDILAADKILITYPDHSSIYQEGKELTSFVKGDYEYACSNDKLMVVNEKRDGINIIDMNTGKTISEISTSSSMDSSAFTSDQEGNWYMVSNSGIHRLVENGSAWEIIADGALASMSMPSFSPDAIITGKEEDFYVMYQSENGKRDIKYYVYNKDISTTPSKTLDVVSLEENSTVRQAIVEFQNMNPDVKVDYRIEMSEEDGTTVMDHIKTINAEFLAGKGADIILLDGMPVDSYIEKGILADLSDIINPLIDNGEVLSNIMESYEKEGKIYTAPIRFVVPFAFGKKEAVKSVDSMQSLAEYVVNAELPVFGAQLHTYTELTSLFFQLYSNGFIGESGAFDEEGLVQFLDQLKMICDQTEVIAEKDSYIEDSYNDLNMMESQLIFDKQAELSLSEISSSSDIFAPMSAIDQTEGDFAIVKDEFIPSGLIGINNASDEKELANKFVQGLYAESVQKTDLGDGLPVNSSALENWGMEEDDLYISSDNFEAVQPSKEKIKSIIDKCKLLKTPIYVDDVLLDMILVETESFLNGETDLHVTANQIIEKTKAYLAE